MFCKWFCSFDAPKSTLREYMKPDAVHRLMYNPYRFKYIFCILFCSFAAPKILTGWTYDVHKLVMEPKQRLKHNLGPENTILYETREYYYQFYLFCVYIICAFEATRLLDTNIRIILICRYIVKCSRRARSHIMSNLCSIVSFVWFSVCIPGYAKSAKSVHNLFHLYILKTSSQNTTLAIAEICSAHHFALLPLLKITLCVNPKRYIGTWNIFCKCCLLYTSPSPRDA